MKNFCIKQCLNELQKQSATKQRYKDCYDGRHAIEKLINGEPVTNDTFAFVLTPNGVSPSAYAYTVVNGYSVKIKCWAYGRLVCFKSLP